MKTSYLIFFAIFFTVCSSHAQNTFPPSGNVGIGTTSPTLGLLHLNGSGADFLSMNQTNSAQYVQLNAYNNAGFRIVQRSNAPLGFWTNTIERMRIDQNGNVGIRTTAPNANLEVAGSFVVAGNNSNLDNRNGTVPLSFLENTGKMAIGWNRTGGAGETDFISNQGAGGTGGFAFYNHSNTGIENQLMWLTGDGRLMIGLSTGNTGNNKLAVGGGIIAESVTVKLQANWPDYVFKRNYQLRPLSEVKAYIDQNQHLPEIPSQQEMIKKGLDVSEMSKLQMKKIEELTLYLIEKDTEINEQKAISNRLQEQITQLNKKLELLVNKIK